MASIFINLEVQDVGSSDNEEHFDDDNDVFIEQEDDIREQRMGNRPTDQSFEWEESYRHTSARFLDELEQQYTQSSPRSEHSTTTPVLSPSILGKRKEHDRDFEFQQQIVSCSTTTEVFGDPWIEGTPPSELFRKGFPKQLSKGFVKARELCDWASWAKQEGRRLEYAPGEWVTIRRGTYKGDIRMVWKLKTREKTEAELQVETEAVEESVWSWKPLPETSSELVEEGYWVFLVPRLPPPYLTHECSLCLKQKQSKGAQPFPRRKFVPAKYNFELLRWNDQLVQGYNIDGHMLSRGLLMKVYRIDGLDPCPLVSLNTLLDFRLAFGEHPFCKRFLLPVTNMWTFAVGDEVDVEVLNSPTSPQSGRGVVSFAGEESILVDFGDAGIHPAPIMLLSKVIAIGEYVRVLRGPSTSREGLVVERHGNILGVSERGTRLGIDLFVHLNAISKLPYEATENSLIPWLNIEVTIFRGPHAEGDM
ncbi:hypothetical protein V5O48_017629 [Marasmius crinis-equi]|uniref:Chromatin elongation factor spt5 n=1 Tax=Marasmius crinis-equi TaxID=585013 RepID=A0ABR3ENE5_9AGAR